MDTWEVSSSLKQGKTNQSYGRSNSKWSNETKQEPNQTSEADQNLKQSCYHNGPLDLQRETEQNYRWAGGGRGPGRSWN